MNFVDQLILALLLYLGSFFDGIEVFFFRQFGGEHDYLLKTISPFYLF
jgi:hypothetical protein